MECYSLVLASSLSVQHATNLNLAIVAPFCATTIELNGHFLMEKRVVAPSRPGLTIIMVVVEMLYISRLV
jgi:hypothetical protein